MAKNSVFSFLLILFSLSLIESKRSPIVFIPGLLGSQLEAKVNKTTIASSCKDHDNAGDWFRLWIDFEFIFPGFEKCFVNYMKILYDNSTHQYVSNEGVQIRVPDFGRLDAVEYLSGNSSGFQYLHQFVAYFEKQGYMRGRDLNAAPYDWRHSPVGLGKQGYYDHLYQLIEDSYMRNNKSPVTLIAHSLGGPVVMHFLRQYLHQQDPTGSHDWKDTRIKQVITLSGIFGGSVKILKSLLSGRSIGGLKSLDPLVLREALRSFPSISYMLPSPILWSDSEVLVSTPNRNYTVQDFEMLFKDVKYTEGIQFLNEFRNIFKDNFAVPPNVTFYCFYGTNVSTDARFMYRDSFPDQEPHAEYGNGDGSVNERSLESCRLWRQELPIISKGFPHVNHFDMIIDHTVHDAVKDLVIN